MTSFAGQILLESVVVPAFIAGIVAFQARWLRHRVSHVLVYAAAFLCAMSASYVLVFGWPAPPLLGARQKIAFLTGIGLVAGVWLSFGGTRFFLLALLTAGPLWIGWPLFLQGRADIVLLALPLILAPLIAGFRATGHGQAPRSGETEHLGLMMIAAIGLALIALFAQTLSIMQLGLALASALAGALLLGRKPPESVLFAAGATMLSGLLTALLLYSEASPPALFTLALIVAVPFVRNLLSKMGVASILAWPALSMAMILTAVAVGMAWIDAGSIFVY